MVEDLNTFEKWVRKDGEHWIWEGGARVRVGKEVTTPRRAGVILSKQSRHLSVPGKLLVAQCGVEECVRPSHQEAITKQEMGKRSYGILTSPEVREIPRIVKKKKGKKTLDSLLELKETLERILWDVENQVKILQSHEGSQQKTR